MTVCPSSFPSIPQKWVKCQPDPWWLPSSRPRLWKTAHWIRFFTYEKHDDVPQTVGLPGADPQKLLQRWVFSDPIEVIESGPRPFSSWSTTTTGSQAELLESKSEGLKVENLHVLLSKFDHDLTERYRTPESWFGFGESSQNSLISDKWIIIIYQDVHLMFMNGSTYIWM